MKLYRTNLGCFVEERGSIMRSVDFDGCAGYPRRFAGYLLSIIDLSGWRGFTVSELDFASAQILAPIGNQEVWAAGVTYYRSRSDEWKSQKVRVEAISTNAFIRQNVQSCSSRPRSNRLARTRKLHTHSHGCLHGRFQNRNSRCLSTIGARSSAIPLETT